MGWELVGHPKTVKITKKLAADWAAMEPVGADRPLSEIRLQVYAKMLKEGGFRPVSWAKVHVEETGETYRVNGKHTSTLFSTADPPEGVQLYAVLEEYRADTSLDASALYATFDSKTQTRTVTDINRQFASVIPELAGYDTVTINLMVGSLNYNIMETNQGNKKTTAAKAEALFENVERIQWVLGIIGHRTGKGRGLGITFNPLWRVPVVAAMLKTYDKAKGSATEFWTAVRDETGSSPDKPDRRLAKWLGAFRLVGGKSDRGVVRYYTQPREFYVRCITAWNAWRGGEKTELKYFPAAKVPVAK